MIRPWLWSAASRPSRLNANIRTLFCTYTFSSQNGPALEFNWEESHCSAQSTGPYTWNGRILLSPSKGRARPWFPVVIPNPLLSRFCTLRGCVLTIFLEFLGMSYRRQRITNQPQFFPLSFIALAASNIYNMVLSIKNVHQIRWCVGRKGGYWDYTRWIDY